MQLTMTALTEAWRNVEHITLQHIHADGTRTEYTGFPARITRLPNGIVSIYLSDLPNQPVYLRYTMVSHESDVIEPVPDTVFPRFEVMQIIVEERSVDDWKACLVFSDRECPGMAYEISMCDCTPAKAVQLAYDLFLDDPELHADNHWKRLDGYCTPDNHFAGPDKMENSSDEVRTMQCRPTVGRPTQGGK